MADSTTVADVTGVRHAPYGHTVRPDGSEATAGTLATDRGREPAGGARVAGLLSAVGLVHDQDVAVRVV